MTIEAIAVGPVAGTGRTAPWFRDMRSGCVFHATTPALSPCLWQQYLHGAVETYRRYGVERVLEHDSIANGRSTSLFFVATDAEGAIVAGVRVQGPYTTAEQAHALREWRGFPGRPALKSMIAERIPAGVVEFKGWWVARDAAHRSELTDAASRCAVHAPVLLGARYAFGTVASFTIDRHRSTGGEVAEHIPAVPYPDSRYQTVPVWWDTRSYRTHIATSQALLIRAEQRALRRSGAVDPNGGRSNRRGAEAWHGDGC